MLIEAGYTDVTVADISDAALARAQTELGAAAAEIKWIAADVRSHDFGRMFELWHDRAVFLFMVEETDRQGYVAVLRRTLRPGGHLVLASFGPDGPTQCSGLPVARYRAEELADTLGSDFDLIAARTQDHRTPTGKHQQFTYTHFQRRLRLDRKAVVADRRDLTGRDDSFSINPALFCRRRQESAATEHGQLPIPPRALASTFEPHDGRT